MKQCPFESFKTRIGLGKKKNIGEDIEIKEKTKNILDYLSARDLITITSEKQTISLKNFYENLNEIADSDDLQYAENIKNHISENLIHYKELKKELNNLHIKMFWEFFKQEISNLGEHDFFGMIDGKLHKKSKKIYVGAFPFLTIKKSVRIKKSIEAIGLFYGDYKEVIDYLYEYFCKKYSENHIVKGYLFLEDLINLETGFDSSITSIFPNVNYKILLRYMDYQVENNGELSYKGFQDFLGKQNRHNINLAIKGGIFSSEVFNRGGDSVKYNNERGIVTFDISDMGENEKLDIKNFIKEFPPIGDGKCPFARTKLGKQNALIDHFEFFDKYMLKILAQFFD